MKKGFISITVIYSFLLLFIFTLLTLLVLYTQKTRLIDTVVYEAKENLKDKDFLSDGTTYFEYTGNYQEYTTKKSGYYYIETYGAQGGDIITPNQVSSATFLGGRGGFSSGYIYLLANETLYIYVGGQGEGDNGEEISQSANHVSLGGYNGGGNGKNHSSTGRIATGGGGATDIRYFGNAIPTSEDLKWDSILGLKSRIIVAGGGGGAFSCVICQGEFNSSGGAGGGLAGGYAYGINNTNPQTRADGGTQTTGANFGKGYDSTNTSQTPGGGGGYYGGNKNTLSAGGGSSYISGYPGVNSISTDFNHTYNTKHYSGLYFIGGVMKSGIRKGNGYAKITYIGNLPSRKNSDLDNVRYIKNCINGNNNNSYNHWIEIQAIKDGANISKYKSTTGAVVSDIITDGNIANETSASGGTGLECVTIDLGGTYDIDQLGVWNPNSRIYFDNITYVSSDNTNWKKILYDDGINMFQGNIANAYDDFHKNYTRIEYLTLNGTTSLNTLIKPTRRTNVLIDASVSSLQSQTRLFSTTGDLFYELYINGNLKWASAFQNNSGDWTQTGTLADNNRHIFLLSGIEKKLFIYHDATASSDLTNNTVTKNANNNLYLFGTSSGNFMKGNVYSAKIYESNTLVMDLIPAINKSDSSVGFYDRISDSFISIAGAIAH